MASQWMRTSDNVQIEPGLWVFTYDYAWGQVDEDDFNRVLERNQGFVERGIELKSDDFWFDVTYPDGSQGWMNGDRMTTRCPRCYHGKEGCKC